MEEGEQLKIIRHFYRLFKTTYTGTTNLCMKMNGQKNSSRMKLIVLFVGLVVLGQFLESRFQNYLNERQKSSLDKSIGVQN